MTVFNHVDLLRNSYIRLPISVQELVPKLVSYFQWWAETRDVDGNGLVTIIHGWESGLDASPAYDEAYFINVPQYAACLSNHMPIDVNGYKTMSWFY
jgi:hypothetical protein